MGMQRSPQAACPLDNLPGPMPFSKWGWGEARGQKGRQWGTQLRSALGRQASSPGWSGAPANHGFKALSARVSTLHFYMEQPSCGLRTHSSRFPSPRVGFMSGHSLCLVQCKAAW